MNKRLLRKAISILIAVIMITTSINYQPISAVAKENENIGKEENAQVIQIDDCDHDYEEIENVAATCTDAGLKVEKCTKCYDVEEITLDLDEYETLETSHDYENDFDKTYTFESPFENTVAISFKFDSNTMFESNYDFAYIHDADGYSVYDSDASNGNSVYRKEPNAYTGGSLANKTFKVYGNKFDVRVTTDSSSTRYGFRISEIKVWVGTGLKATRLEALGHDFSELVSVTAPTCNTDGYTTYKCIRCPLTENGDIVSKTEEHDYVDGKCSVCGRYMPATEITADNYTDYGLSSNYIGYRAMETATDLAWLAQQIQLDRAQYDAVLINDIDYTEYTEKEYCIGYGDHFRKIFDGRGHKITVDFDLSQQYAGLFYSTYSANIKNLYVDGTVKTDKKFAGGLVGRVYVNTSIENCISAVAIESSVNGDGTHGGIVGLGDGTSTISNCAFIGSITGENTNSCAGILGWTDSASTRIRDCFVNATFNTDTEACSSIKRSSSGTVTNCYYVTEYGDETDGSSQVTAEDVASGKLAYLLNGSTETESKWFQDIGTDSYPVPDSTHGRVYRNETDDGVVFSNVKTHRYINGICKDCNETIPATVVTAENKEELGLSDDYIGYYAIENAGQLMSFATVVNSENDSANGVLLADVSLDGISNYEPIGYVNGIDYGSANLAKLGYKGEFDGRGFVISDIQAQYNSKYASSGVFGSVSGTVKNLGVDNYTYRNTSYDGRFGAVTGQVLPGGTVDNCYVINSELTDANHITGMIAGCNYGGTISNCYEYNNSQTTHQRCGKLVGDNRNDTSTLIGTINNCYSTAQVEGEYKGTVENSQENVSLNDFTNGKVAYLLNGSQSKDVIWYQLLDGSSLPTLKANDEFVVYAVVDCMGNTIEEYLNEIKQGEHKYVCTYNGDETHSNICEYCEVVEEGSTEDCSLSEWTSNGSENHIRTCNKCSNVKTEVHEFVLEYTEEGDCYNEGYNRYKCLTCGETKNESLGYVHDYKKIKTVKPTCLNQGYTEYVCTICENKKDDDFTDAIDHEFELVRTIDSTCEKAGTKIYKCKYCGTKNEEVIEQLNHKFPDEPSRIDNPTCEETGTKYYTCEICKNEIGHQNIDTEYFQSKHPYSNDLGNTSGIYDENNYEEGISQWTFEAGVMVESIDVKFSPQWEFEGSCDYIRIYDMNKNLVYDGYKDSPLDGKSIHIEGNKFIITLRTDSSVVKSGFAVDEITVNYAEGFEDIFSIPALGHNFVDGKCTQCGKKEGSIVVSYQSDDKTLTKKFDGLSEAWNFAEGKTATIKVNEDISENEYIVCEDPNSNITFDFGESNIKLNNSIIVASGTVTLKATTGTITSDYSVIVEVYEVGNVIIKGGNYISKDDAAIYADSRNSSLTIHDGHFQGMIGALLGRGSVNIYGGEFDGVFGAIYIVGDMISKKSLNLDIQDGDSQEIGGVKEDIQAEGIQISGGVFKSGMQGSIVADNSKKLRNVITTGYAAYVLDKDGEASDQLIEYMDSSRIKEAVTVALHESHNFGNEGVCSSCGMYDNDGDESAVAVVITEDGYEFVDSLDVALKKADGKKATIKILAEDYVLLNEDATLGEGSDITIKADGSGIVSKGPVLSVEAGNLTIEGKFFSNCISLENGETFADVLAKGYAIYSMFDDKEAKADEITYMDGTYFVRLHDKHKYNEDGICEVCSADAIISATFVIDGVETYKPFNRFYDLVCEVNSITFEESAQVNVNVNEDLTTYEYAVLNFSNDIELNIYFNDKTYECEGIEIESGTVNLYGTSGGIIVSENSLYVTENANVTINSGAYESYYCRVVETYLDNGSLTIKGGKFRNAYGYGLIRVNDNELKDLLPVGYLFVDEKGNAVTEDTIIYGSLDIDYIEVVEHEKHRFEFGECIECRLPYEDMDEAAVVEVCVDGKNTYYTSLNDAMDAVEGKTATIRVLRDLSISEDIVIDNEDTDITFIAKDDTYCKISASDNVNIIVKKGKLKMDGLYEFNCIKLENGQTLQNITLDGFVVYNSLNEVADADITETNGNYYIIDKCYNHNINAETIRCNYCNERASFAVKYSDGTKTYCLNYDELVEVIGDASSDLEVTLLRDYTVDKYSASIYSDQSVTFDFGENTLTCRNIEIGGEQYILKGTTGGITCTNGSLAIYAPTKIESGVYTSHTYEAIEICDSQVHISGGTFKGKGYGFIYVSSGNVADYTEHGMVYIDDLGNICNTDYYYLEIIGKASSVTLVEHENHNIVDGICIQCGYADSSVAVASVDVDDSTTYFFNLVDAFEYANDKNATITLLQDCETFEQIVIYAGDIVIDLNGHNWNQNDYFEICGGKVEFKGEGTISSVEEAVYVYAEPDCGEIEVIFNGGRYISEDDNAITVANYYSDDVKITINDGYFEGEDDAIAAFESSSQNGKESITINGGTFIAHYYNALEINLSIYEDEGNDSYLEINGGTFTSENYDHEVINLYGNRLNVVINDCDVKGPDSALFARNIKNIQINGGSFVSTNDWGLYVYNTDLEINGGSFSSISYDNYLTKTLTSGYVFENEDGTCFGKENENYKYSINRPVKVVKHLRHILNEGKCAICGVEGSGDAYVIVGEETIFYDTLEDAINGLSDIENLESATVVCGTNTTFTSAVEIDVDADITIEFKNISTEEGIVVKSGTVTFDGGSITTSGEAKAVTAADEGKIKFKSGTYTGVDANEDLLIDTIDDGYVWTDVNGDIIFDKLSDDVSTSSQITVTKHTEHVFENNICSICGELAKASVTTVVDEEEITEVFGTFDQAWSYATSNDVAVIDLLADVQIDDNKYATNKDITLNIGEYNITFEDEYFYITDCHFTVNATTGGIFGREYAIYATNNTTLDISGGVYKTSNDYTIYVPYYDNESYINISNAKIEGYESLVLNNTIAEIKNCELIGNYTSYLYRADVTFTECDFKDSGIYVEESYAELNDCVIKAEGYEAISAYDGSTVYVNGGIYSSKYEASIYLAESTIEINGGEFSADRYYVFDGHPGNITINSAIVKKCPGYEIFDYEGTISDILGDNVRCTNLNGKTVPANTELYDINCDIAFAKCEHEDEMVTAVGEYHIYYCPDCGKNIEEDCDYEIVEVVKGCSEDGYTLFRCKVCNQEYVSEFTPMLGHSFTEYVSNNDATCEVDGTKTAICDNGCGETRTIVDEGTALGHSFTEYVSNNDATCEADGTKTAICDNGCGTIDITDDEGSAKGHSYGEWVCNENGTHSKVCIEDDDEVTEECVYTSITVVPTCTEEGYTEYTCSECGYTYKDDFVAALGHAHTMTTLVKANPFEDGSRTVECIVCEQEIENEIISRPDVIALSETSYLYDGTEKTPEVTVMDAEGEIIDSSAYTVVYSNNIEVGTATVTVSFSSKKYYGRMTAEFTIKSVEVTTVEPTTVDSTTVAPTTGVEPTTVAPTTGVDPTTVAPTTGVEPTTVAPTTGVETTTKVDTTTAVEQPTSGKVSTPKAVKLKAVAKKKLSAKKLKLTVVKVANAKGYQVSVYKTKKNAKKNKKALVIKVTKKNVAKITISSKKLKNKKVLFIRVRAYAIGEKNSKVYGNWSKVKKIKVKK